MAVDLIAYDARQAYIFLSCLRTLLIVAPFVHALFIAFLCLRLLYMLFLHEQTRTTSQVIVRFVIMFIAVELIFGGSSFMPLPDKLASPSKIRNIYTYRNPGGNAKETTGVNALPVAPSDRFAEFRDDFAFEDVSDSLASTLSFENLQLFEIPGETAGLSKTETVKNVILGGIPTMDKIGETVKYMNQLLERRHGGPFLSSAIIALVNSFMLTAVTACQPMDLDNVLAAAQEIAASANQVNEGGDSQALSGWSDRYAGAPAQGDAIVVPTQKFSPGGPPGEIRLLGRYFNSLSQVHAETVVDLKDSGQSFEDIATSLGYDAKGIHPAYFFRTHIGEYVSECRDLYGFSSEGQKALKSGEKKRLSTSPLELLNPCYISVFSVKKEGQPVANAGEETLKAAKSQGGKLGETGESAVRSFGEDMAESAKGGAGSGSICGNRLEKFDTVDAELEKFKSLESSAKSSSGVLAANLPCIRLGKNLAASFIASVKKAEVNSEAMEQKIREGAGEVAYYYDGFATTSTVGNVFALMPYSREMSNFASIGGISLDSVMFPGIGLAFTESGLSSAAAHKKFVAGAVGTAAAGAAIVKAAPVIKTIADNPKVISGWFTTFFRKSAAFLRKSWRVTRGAGKFLLRRGTKLLTRGLSAPLSIVMSILQMCGIIVFGLMFSTLYYTSSLSGGVFLAGTGVAGSMLPALSHESSAVTKTMLMLPTIGLGTFLVGFGGHILDTGVSLSDMMFQLGKLATQGAMFALGADALTDFAKPSSMLDTLMTMLFPFGLLGGLSVVPGILSAALLSGVGGQFAPTHGEQILGSSVQQIQHGMSSTGALARILSSDALSHSGSEGKTPNAAGSEVETPNTIDAANKSMTPKTAVRRMGG